MNIKKLTEDKNSKTTEMQTLLDNVKAEERAFTEDEQKLFDKLKGEIEAINNTIKAFEDSRELVDEDEKEAKKEEEDKMTEEERESLTSNKMEKIDEILVHFHSHTF